MAKKTNERGLGEGYLLDEKSKKINVFLVGALAVRK